MQDSSWLESEFVRTGLPRSALAAYLGLDNAAVSRLSRGERVFGSEELQLARSFFSIVPQTERPDPGIRKLRTTRIRERASAELVRVMRVLPAWCEGNTQVRDLIGRGGQEQVVLRADQIVALSRCVGLSVDALLQRDWDPKKLEKISLDLDKAAQRWASESVAKLAYDISRGANRAPKHQSPVKQRPIFLRPAEDRLDRFKKCLAYVIPDDSLTPWFGRGQIIYLEEPAAPRKDDYIAILMSAEREIGAKALIGKFIYRSRQLVCIQLANGEEQEIEENRITEIRRIAFCGF